MNPFRFFTTMLAALALTFIGLCLFASVLVHNVDGMVYYGIGTIISGVILRLLTK